jgi:hypothetical protein
MKKFIHQMLIFMWAFLCLYLLHYLKVKYNFNFVAYLLVGIPMTYIGMFLINRLFKINK